MANAYNGLYPAQEDLTVGQNIAGAQVSFQWAGRTIQLPVPAGSSPISVVNAYLDALKSGFGASATVAQEVSSGHDYALQPAEDPDNLEHIDAPSLDPIPEEAVVINTITANENPQDSNYVSGSQPSNFGSTWTPDGVNTIRGYQPVSSIPVLASKAVSVQIPSLEGFFQGTVRIGGALAELPLLRKRRGFVSASTGMLTGG